MAGPVRRAIIMYLNTCMLDAGFQMAGWLLLTCGTPMTQADTVCIPFLYQRGMQSRSRYWVQQPNHCSKLLHISN
jgi:hypothetical protein